MKKSKLPHQRALQKSRGYYSETHYQTVDPCKNSNHGFQSDDCLFTGLRTVIDQLQSSGQKGFCTGSRRYGYFYDILCTVDGLNCEFEKLEKLASAKVLNKNQNYQTTDSGDSIDDMIYLTLTANTLLKHIISLKQDIIQYTNDSHQRNDGTVNQTSHLINALETKLHSLLGKLRSHKMHFRNTMNMSKHHHDCKKHFCNGTGTSDQEKHHISHDYSSDTDMSSSDTSKHSESHFPKRNDKMKSSSKNIIRDAKRYCFNRKKCGCSEDFIINEMHMTDSTNKRENAKNVRHMSTDRQKINCLNDYNTNEHSRHVSKEPCGFIFQNPKARSIIVTNKYTENQLLRPLNNHVKNSAQRTKNSFLPIDKFHNESNNFKNKLRTRAGNDQLIQSNQRNRPHKRSSLRKSKFEGRERQRSINSNERKHRPFKRFGISKSPYRTPHYSIKKNRIHEKKYNRPRTISISSTDSSTGSSTFQKESTYSKKRKVRPGNRFKISKSPYKTHRFSIKKNKTNDKKYYRLRRKSTSSTDASTGSSSSSSTSSRESHKKENKVIYVKGHSRRIREGPRKSKKTRVHIVRRSPKGFKVKPSKRRGVPIRYKPRPTKTRERVYVYEKRPMTVNEEIYHRPQYKRKSTRKRRTPSYGENFDNVPFEREYYFPLSATCNQIPFSRYPCRSPIPHPMCETYVDYPQYGGYQQPNTCSPHCEHRCTPAYSEEDDRMVRECFEPIKMRSHVKSHHVSSEPSVQRVAKPKGGKRYISRKRIPSQLNSKKTRKIKVSDEIEPVPKPLRTKELKKVPTEITEHVWHREYTTQSNDFSSETKPSTSEVSSFQFSPFESRSPTGKAESTTSTTGMESKYVQVSKSEAAMTTSATNTDYTKTYERGVQVSTRSRGRGEPVMVDSTTNTATSRFKDYSTQTTKYKTSGRENATQTSVESIPIKIYEKPKRPNMNTTGTTTDPIPEVNYVPKQTHTVKVNTDVLPKSTKRTSTTDIIRLVNAIGTNTPKIKLREKGIDPIPQRDLTTPPSTRPNMISEFTNTDKIHKFTRGTDAISGKPKPIMTNTAVDPVFQDELPKSQKLNDVFEKSYTQVTTTDAATSYDFGITSMCNIDPIDLLIQSKGKDNAAVQVKPEVENDFTQTLRNMISKQTSVKEETEKFISKTDQKYTFPKNTYRIIKKESQTLVPSAIVRYPSPPHYVNEKILIKEKSKNTSEKNVQGSFIEYPKIIYKVIKGEEQHLDPPTIVKYPSLPHHVNEKRLIREQTKEPQLPEQQPPTDRRPIIKKEPSFRIVNLPEQKSPPNKFFVPSIVHTPERRPPSSKPIISSSFEQPTTPTLQPKATNSAPSEFSMHLVLEKHHEEIYRKRSCIFNACSPECEKECSFIVCEKRRSNVIIISHKSASEAKYTNRKIRSNLDIAQSTNEIPFSLKIQNTKLPLHNQTQDGESKHLTGLNKDCDMKMYKIPLRHHVSRKDPHDELNNAETPVEFTNISGNDIVLLPFSWSEVAREVK